MQYNMQYKNRSNVNPNIIFILTWSHRFILAKRQKIWLNLRHYADQLESKVKEFHFNILTNSYLILKYKEYTSMDNQESCPVISVNENPALC